MSDLLEVRTRVQEFTGRADLADARIDAFINTGQRQLDMMQPTPKSRMGYRKDAVVGDHKLEFENCMAVEEVWIAGATDADDRKLIKVNYDFIRKCFAGPIASLTNGTPAYWCPFPVGLSPQQEDLTSGDYTDEFTYDWEDVSFGTGHLDDRAILFLPPTDTIKTIVILGQFFSKTLVEDTDVSYWTTMYPDLLAHASAWAMEIAVRNTEGMRDWMRAMQVQLTGIDHILVSEESEGVTQILG